MLYQIEFLDIQRKMSWSYNFIRRKDKMRRLIQENNIYDESDLLQREINDQLELNN
jgi:hypothetical protein